MQLRLVKIERWRRYSLMQFKRQRKIYLKGKVQIKVALKGLLLSWMSLMSKKLSMRILQRLISKLFWIYLCLILQFLSKYMTKFLKQKVLILGLKMKRFLWSLQLEALFLGINRRAFFIWKKAGIKTQEFLQHLSCPLIYPQAATEQLLIHRVKPLFSHQKLIKVKIFRLKTSIMLALI